MIQPSVVKEPYVWRWLVLLGLVHFSTELACSFWLTRTVEGALLGGGGVFCYNALAFWSQPLAGWLVDRARGAKVAMLFGGCLVVSAGIFWTTYPWMTVVLLGAGNSLVHVGTGALCVGLSRGRASGLGVLVGPGAAGLVVGIYLCDQAWSGAPWMIAGLLLTALAVSWPIERRVESSEETMAGISVKKLFLVAILILFCIALRSALGSGFSFAWRSEANAGLAIGLAMAAGKVAGGFLADATGWIVAVTVAIVGAIPFLWFGISSEWAGLVGLALFQMPMAVTLGMLVRLFPVRPAFAFGLASAAVYGGAFLVSDGATALLEDFALLSGLSVCAVAMLWYVTKIAPTVASRR